MFRSKMKEDVEKRAGWLWNGVNPECRPPRTISEPLWGKSVHRVVIFWPPEGQFLDLTEANF